MSLLLAFVVGKTVSAASCTLPPVMDADHAVCLARAFVEDAQLRQWETVYEPINIESQWVVRYRPQSSSVRGGAGLLEIAKATGTGSVVRGER